MTNDFDTLHPRSSDGTGQFTEKPQADPGTTVISQPDAGVEALRAIWGPGMFSEQQYEKALRETGGDLGKAQVWLRREHDQEAAWGDVMHHREVMEHARRHAAQASVRACVQRILQFYGDKVTDIYLADNGEGDPMWQVETDDAPWGDNLDDDIVDAVYEMTAVDLRHPGDLASCCTGFDNQEGSGYADGLLIDWRTSRLARAQIDLDKFTV